jgi:hypothetical protein
MRKFLLSSALAAGTLLVAQSAFAQPSTSACALNPAQYFGAVCFTPNPLPCGVVGQPYNESVKFVAAQKITQPLPLDLNKVEVLKVEVFKKDGSKVNASDVGMTITFVSGNPVDNANIATAKAFTPVAGNGFGPFGEIKVSGTPNAEVDSLSLSIRVNDAIEIPGPVSQTPINIDLSFKNGSCATSIDAAFARELNLTVAPNPVADNANLRFNLANSGTYNVRVVSIDGRVVLAKTLVNQAAGANEVALETQALPAGIYNVEFTSGSSSAVTRFVKN